MGARRAEAAGWSFSARRPPRLKEGAVLLRIGDHEIQTVTVGFRRGEEEHTVAVTVEAR